MESQKNIRLILIILGLFACVDAFAWYLAGTTMQHQEEQKQLAAQSKSLEQSISNQSIANTTTMKIQSSLFENNGTLDSAFTCDGENVNPPLQISEVPQNTKSLALIVDDPDAPSGDWVHWLVWNIDPKTQEISQNTIPVGAVQGQTDFGQNKWSGPCPPSGAHHYHFKLYALDTMLQIPETFKKTELLEAIQTHIIGQTELIGVYQRKK
jgi:Raf kinase inhibitor-like YbhB/YbcL family protein